MYAHAHSSRWGRIAVIAAVVFVVGMLALPATAAARTVTRIVVAKSVTVDNSDPLVSAWPKAMTVKLQRRLSSGSYRGFSGTVKCYFYNDDHEWEYVSKHYGSTMTFKLPQRGKYKFRYAGSSTKQPCTAYCSVKEDIGFVIDAHGAVVTPVEGSSTESWVTLTYSLTWNTNAWDGRVWLGSDMDFGNTEAVYCYYERRLQAPGDVEFTFRVKNEEILPTLYEETWAYADWDDWSEPSYVVEESISNTYPMN
jgi:hypothetical protein